MFNGQKNRVSWMWTLKKLCGNVMGTLCMTVSARTWSGQPKHQGIWFKKSMQSGCLSAISDEEQVMLVE